jgi:MFS family permease
MRTIDTAGRRAWLLATLPIMSLSLMAAAIAFPSETDMHQARSTVGVVFIFIFVAAYSPGLGPIPFTLASESFPLTHREAGASVAIAINLFFAGILTIVLPAIKTALTTRGTLGFFSGMNVLAFVLVFFLVEETRRLSLEDLDEVYKHSKSKFIKFQLYEWLPYVFKRYALRRKSARNDPGPRYDRYVEEDGGQGDELQHMSE